MTAQIASATTPANSTALLLPREVANIFRVDPKTVARWEDMGKIAGVRTAGGHRRYRAFSIYEMYVESAALTGDDVPSFDEWLQQVAH